MARYFDISDIMVGEERVPVEFLTHAYRLGHLDTSAASEDIEENQQLELPLWLAEPLAEKRLVVVDLPRNFSSKVGALAWRM